jgi:hypothetical protein
MIAVTSTASGEGRQTMDFLLVTFGAVVGAVAGFIGSWWQNKRVLEHDRREARLVRSQQIAIEMLGTLTRWEHTESPNGDGADRGHAAVDAHISAFRHHVEASGLLLPEQLRERVASMLDLMTQIRASAVVDPGSDLTTDAELLQRANRWTSERYSRSLTELMNYCAYVRDSLVAFIQGNGTPTRPSGSRLRTTTRW